MLLNHIRTVRRIALCVVVVGGAWIFGSEIQGRIVDPVEARRGYEAVDVNTAPVQFDERRFYDSVERTETDVKVVDGEIKGAIIPHHALASDLIAEAFGQLALSSHPSTIVIVGPNHEEVGDGNAITSSLDWKMSNGNVGHDGSFMSELVTDGYTVEDNNVVVDEHSVGTLIPYIAHYFPDAKVVPIVLSSKHDIFQSEKLGEALADKNTLIIASVDFSHYLPLNIANEHDLVTSRAIDARDSATIAQMNSDYLDSPPSLITLFSAMDALNANEQTLLQHTNSAVIEGVEAESTTSYFTILFH
ncbi:AmmeMemoRadiSam system protein B [Candidatus Uhrbacteria bacterium]|nr:AmmeMemoRadiSam system protein B [Candidatus Uhrbacteria bacterium]